MSDTRSGYVPPAHDKTAFNCPYCHAFANQKWQHVGLRPFEKDIAPNMFSKELSENLKLKEAFESITPKLTASTSSVGMGHVYGLNIAICFNCKKFSIWVGRQLIWPLRGNAPIPNPDMPDEIRKDYDEASAILDLSPRGSAALLRLCIQKICMHVGETGKNLNNDIAALVQKGLQPHVQKALDIVRVIGNSAVHPGQIDLRDDRAVAESLFNLINIIIDSLISQPKSIREMYENLPKGALDAIDQRDSKL